MKMPIVASFSLLLAAASLAPGGWAQQAAPAQAKPAQQVVLPVTVRDKHGALLADVQKSDLTLTIDGRPVAIQDLTRDSTKPFRIGLVMDTSKGMQGALPEERKAAEQFIDDMLPASGDSKNQIFLIHFDKEVELLRDFTNSRDKLHTELDDMGSTRPQDASYNSPETADDQRPRPGHDGTQLYDAVYLACNELMQQQHGRKALIVFSNGADHGSKETMNEAVDAADRANVALYTIFFKGESENQNNPYQGNRRRSSVGFPGGGGGYPRGGGGYPGDNRRNPEPRSATGIDGKKIMQEMATRTGGHAFEARKTTDLEPIFKLIDQDLHGQYLLTFTPDKAASEDGFHKVAITTEKKDWTISTREGYYTGQD